MQLKKLIKNIALFSMVTSVALTGGVGGAFAKEAPAYSDTPSYEVQHAEQETKYSKHVMRVLRESLGVDANSTEKDSEIEGMAKVQVMDSYLASFGKKVKGHEIRRAVEEVFDIDLNLTSKNNYGTKLTIYPEYIMESLRASFNEEPDSTEQDARIMELSKNAVMDRYIKEQGYDMTGKESRTLINQIYGVNLDGISRLEYTQLGILSKGQWIIKSDTDLYILESSLDDVEVSIYVTPYYKEVTGLSKLPEASESKLMEMGFEYIKDTEVLYYKNPDNVSVPDDFKTQVIRTILAPA